SLHRVRRQKTDHLTGQRHKVRQFQRDDTGETVAVEVVMRGRQKEIDTGEGKQGEDTESKISVVCTYFRLTMDGKELVEIDTINMIEKVNGVDRLEQHRRNIGL
ncbi:phage major tail tube protein, partial [Escherichia coli]